MAEAFAKLLVFTVAAGIVALLGRLALRSKPDQLGWRQIKPGAMHWTGAMLGAALFFLMAYVWMFVGSTRPDGAAQMRILFWLMLAFGTATVISAVSIDAIRCARVHWRGRIITFAGADGAVQVDLDQVRGLKQGTFGYTVDFDGGHSVRIDPYATGAAQLLDLISEELALRQQTTGA